VIPIKTDGSKAASLPSWKVFQERIASEEEVRRWFAGPRLRGIAIVCGAVSELEVIDFDAPGMYATWKELVESVVPDALQHVAVVKTPKPDGHHVYLHRLAPEPNQKLAQRSVAGPDGRSKRVTLIETRGEGGYVLAPGCPPECHPLKAPYEHVAGLSIEDVRAQPPLSDELYALFIHAARALSEIEQKDVEHEVRHPGEQADGFDGRPGSDFNRRATWPEVLLKHDWTCTRDNGKEAYWRRPDKAGRGISATTGHCSNTTSGDLLYVFSSNAAPFEAGRAYSKFAAYTLLNHNGDFRAAAKELASQGYGSGERKKSHGASGPLPENLPKDDEPHANPPLTDTGNAERLAAKYGQDFRFCHPWKKWVEWDGKRWKVDESGKAMAHSKAVVRNLYAEASSIEDTNVRQCTADWARACEKVDRRRAMVELTKSERGIPILPDQFDRHSNLLNVANGVLDLKTFELRLHNRGDYLTKLCVTKYVADAACPTFAAFIERVVPRDEERAFLQRFLGYCLTGEVTEQMILFAIGEGANGKTTLFHAIQDLMSSSYAIQIPTDLLVAKHQRNHPTEVADLFGVRLAVGVETQQNEGLDEAFVKQITGGDRIRARRMREDFWEFDPTHKIVVISNHMPHIRGRDYAIFRRIHVLHFDVTIPVAERDKALLSKLAGEREGILAWMVQGCRAWRANGLCPPEGIQLRKHHWHEPEAAEAFVEQFVERQPPARTRASEIFAAFTAWCVANRLEEGSQQALGRALGAAGFGSKKTGGVMVYLDARLRPSSPTPEGGSGRGRDHLCIDPLGTPREGDECRGGPFPPSSSPNADETAAERHAGRVEGAGANASPASAVATEANPDGWVSA
jgi:putative DNA primase/helicase